MAAAMAVADDVVVVVDVVGVEVVVVVEEGLQP